LGRVEPVAQPAEGNSVYCLVGLKCPFRASCRKGIVHESGAYQHFVVLAGMVAAFEMPMGSSLSLMTDDGSIVGSGEYRDGKLKLSLLEDYSGFASLTVTDQNGNQVTLEVMITADGQIMVLSADASFLNLAESIAGQGGEVEVEYESSFAATPALPEQAQAGRANADARQAASTDDSDDIDAADEQPANAPNERAAQGQQNAAQGAANAEDGAGNAHERAGEQRVGTPAATPGRPTERPAPSRDEAAGTTARPSEPQRPEAPQGRPESVPTNERVPVGSDQGSQGSAFEHAGAAETPEDVNRTEEETGGEGRPDDAGRPKGAGEAGERSKRGN
jgi:hypothetical protein